MGRFHFVATHLRSTGIFSLHLSWSYRIQIQIGKSSMKNESHISRHWIRGERLYWSVRDTGARRSRPQGHQRQEFLALYDTFDSPSFTPAVIGLISTTGIEDAQQLSETGRKVLEEGQQTHCKLDVHDIANLERTRRSKDRRFRKNSVRTHIS